MFLYSYPQDPSVIMSAQGSLRRFGYVDSMLRGRHLVIIHDTYYYQIS